MSCVLSILLVATIPLRNPFWPVGYHGEMEPIVDSVTVQSATEGTAEEEKQTSAAEAAAAIAAAAAAARDEDESVEMERRWVRARKSLRIGGTMKVGGTAGARQAVSINGNIYADNDLISVNHDGYRFTWRVQTLTNNKTLRLIRVRVRELEQGIKTVAQSDAINKVDQADAKSKAVPKEQKGKSK